MGVAVALVVVAGFLIALALLLWTVCKVRPTRFRFKCTVAKWFTTEIDIENGGR